MEQVERQGSCEVEKVLQMRCNSQNNSVNILNEGDHILISQKEDSGHGLEAQVGVVSRQSGNAHF